MDCDVVLKNYDKFKQDFPKVTIQKVDTTAELQASNRLFEKYMNDALGFSKTTVEYLKFIDECNLAGKGCESLSKIRQSYKYVPDYDSTHFFGYGDPVLQPKLRQTYYAGWAHIPDSIVNTNQWGRRYGKLDTLCLGNEFTIVTRIRRPVRDTSNTKVDLNISFNQNGHLQKITPILYMLKKNPTATDSAFVRANSGKIGYVAAGDTIGQVIQKIPDFSTWKIIKIKHTADNYWNPYKVLIIRIPFKDG